MGEKKAVSRGLERKPEGRRPLGRQRRRWKNNIKMPFRKVGWGFMHWIEQSQNRDRWRALVEAVMNIRGV